MNRAILPSRHPRFAFDFGSVAVFLEEEWSRGGVVQVWTAVWTRDQQQLLPSLCKAVAVFSWSSQTSHDSLSCCCYGWLQRKEPDACCGDVSTRFVDRVRRYRRLNLLTSSQIQQLYIKIKRLNRVCIFWRKTLQGVVSRLQARHLNILWYFYWYLLVLLLILHFILR